MTTRDGRNVDLEAGRLDGEASALRVRSPDDAWPVPRSEEILPPPGPADRVPEAEATYYDLPVVKPPPWKWYIPAYFHVGGVAGASAVLGAAASLGRRAELRSLADKAHLIATVGEAVSAGLLIADLGRPARFHHMLRVFRPTSPMNAGTWILSASGAASGVVLVDRLWRGPRGLTVAGAASAIAGAGLTTYTAVLLSNTAVPVWAAARRSMPALFAASAAAGAASLLELIGAGTPAERRVVRVFGGIAKAAELVAARTVEREVGGGAVGRPLRDGRSGRLWRAAAVLGAAGLVATLWPGGGRRRSLVAGLLGTAATVCARVAIVDAGKASADDPRATFASQRGAPG